MKICTFYLIMNAFSMNLGNMNVKSEKLNKLDVIGNFNGNDLEVLNDSNVVGNFTLVKGSFIKGLTITGSTHISDSFLNGPLKLTGRVLFENSEAKNKISITSDYPMFISSDLAQLEGNFKSLTLEKTKSKTINVLSDNKNSLRVIFLKSSIVDGDIIFHDEKGKVTIDSKSKVFGKIVNGVVEQI